MGYLLPDYGAIEARADAATPGPWYVVGPPWNDGAPFVVAGNPDPHAGTFVLDTEDVSDPDLGDEDEAAESLRRHRDAEFVAAARSDVPALATAALRYLKLLAEAERDRDAALAERDAALALAARQAHVLHAVDAWLGDKTARGPAADWERGVLRTVVRTAREQQELVDPYGLAAALADENAQLRRLVARLRRDLGRIDSPATRDPGEAGARAAARGALADVVDVLAELDPLADDDEPEPVRPVRTLALPPEDQR